jgi:hypothetical protein
MAGDNFTQIANALFRDPRISYKAKGIFGIISTHRDGWKLTVVDLVRSSKDGRDAVYAGLKELETFGYLTRSPQRRPDGTMIGYVYEITDVPAHLFELLGEDAATAALSAMKQKKRRSDPLTDYPDTANPDTANPRTKNTNNQNTKNDENNNQPDVRPSVTRAHANQQDETEGRTDTPPSPPKRTEGSDFLQSFAAEHPAYALTGKTLRDQARIIDGLIDIGWTTTALYAALTSRPLPAREDITTSPGAILSARLKDIIATPVPAAAAHFPHEDGQTPVSRPVTTSADKSVAEAQALPLSGECVNLTCGRPVAAGEDYCPACLEYDRCPQCAGGWKPVHAEACQPCHDQTHDNLTATGYNSAPF